MDNLKYYNDSLAYDFSLFMPREKVEKNNDNIIKMPETATRRKQRKRAASKAVSLSLTSVLICSFMLAALCGNIFLRVKITETNSQINDLNTEISELDSSLTKLNVEFEKIISYTSLEKSAAELGMKKMDKNQVIYMRVNNKNSAVTSNGEKVVSEE